MKKRRNKKGVLTIEASISYSIFLMIVVTMMYLMRIVYVYGLMQHAVAQTAKELSMYSYLYQISGVNDLNQQLAGAAGTRTDTFNADVGEVVNFYKEFTTGDFNAKYNGTTDPEELLKNIGAAMISEAGKEANQLLFEAVARPMISSYIGADAQGHSADWRLDALRVIGGTGGLNLNSSSFFEDGATIDLVVCYTIDPIMPIDILPELNLVNRACVRGMAGASVFGESKQEEDKKENSVWDMKSSTERGKVIQDQEHTRNLPSNFPTYSAFDPVSGKASAEASIDLRDSSYKKKDNIRNLIQGKCNKINKFEDTTYAGVTLTNDQIKSREVVVYIPSSKGDRVIDRSLYEEALREVQERNPDINIVTKEID